MENFRHISAVEQVAAHLRSQILRGSWSRSLPGVNALAAELGANNRTVAAALLLLEKERLLVPRGAGRARLIRLPGGRKAHRPLRVAILDYDPPELTEAYTMETMHLLMSAGHNAFFARRCLRNLRMDVGRVARLVAETKADAWLVCSASREVLEWFIAQKVPAFAWFGNRLGLPIAGVGPDKQPATVAAVRHLIELGHRRIVFLAPLGQQPYRAYAAILDELRAGGIATGPYNLPFCEPNPEGMHACLTNLFATTPPTALIVDEVAPFFATMQFVAAHGLLVPRDISLLCTDSSPLFHWNRPAIAHIHWDTRPVVRRIVRWVANMARGRPDTRQTFTPATFVPGGTIGPAKE